MARLSSSPIADGGSEFSSLADACGEWTRTGGEIFAMEFHSDDLQTRIAMARLRAHLAARGLNSEALSTVELVAAEVCNNINEHAYPDTSGRMRIEARIDHSSVVCVFTDQGIPFPDATLPDTPPDPPVSLPEGGFGWYIIRSLTSELHYRRKAQSNHLKLRIPI